MSRLARIPRRLALVCGLIAAAVVAPTAVASITVAYAREPDISGVADMPPYKMVRTLQYVQDQIVAGDHGAIDMQSYLLQSIDKRLRQADSIVFDDGRNADAALIYAMSGGNPATLRLLSSRDAAGHFDHALTDALLTYFSGQPEQALPQLAKLEPSFRDTGIGAYVSLVTANAEAWRHPKKALKLYDWVRLLAPGSIIEESALRRSIDLADRLKRADKGIEYSRDYALRFIHSPYAGQFADLFVQLVIDNTDTVTAADVADVLSAMDGKRQAAIYLRIARAAAIGGKLDLARESATRAGQVPQDHDAETATLASFYQDVSDISSPEVHSAGDSLREIPAADLSARDQALRKAALAVAHQVVAPPGAVAPTVMPAKADPLSQQIVSRQSIPSHPAKTGKVEGKKAKQAFKSFVDAKRDKLAAIDDMLKKATE